MEGTVTIPIHEYELLASVKKDVDTDAENCRTKLERFLGRRLFARILNRRP